MHTEMLIRKPEGAHKEYRNMLEDINTLMLNCMYMYIYLFI